MDTYRDAKRQGIYPPLFTYPDSEAMRARGIIIIVLVKSNWLVKKILRQNIFKTLKFSYCLATLCFCVGMKIKFLSLPRIICKFSYYTQDSHMYILSLNP